MNCNSDFEILPELAESPQISKKVEDYVCYVIEATYYWQRNRCMVKNEIREIFSAISSMLHQRELQLYEQVDALDTLVDSIYHNNAVLAKGLAMGSVLDPGKSCLKSTSVPKEFSGSKISPQLQLKFQSNMECLEEAIHSFGCVEVQDDNISDESNFVFVDSAGDELSMKVEHLSLHTNDLDQNGIVNKTEVSSVASHNSSDSFEVLTDDNASIPWLRKRNNNDIEFISAGCLNSHSTVKKKNDGYLGVFSHTAAAADKAPHSPWLRKPEVFVPEISPATVLTKSLASVLSSSYSVKAKEKRASSLSSSSDVGSVVCDLTNVSLNCKNTPSVAGNAVIANSGIQNSTVSASSSDTVPQISSIICKMLGNGNHGWLNSGSSSLISPLPYSHCNREGTLEAERQKSRLWLNRTVFQKEGSLQVHIKNVGESHHCPYFSVRKMFNPYFKTEDKNKWLVKNHTHQKKITFS